MDVFFMVILMGLLRNVYWMRWNLYFWVALIMRKCLVFVRKL